MTEATYALYVDWNNDGDFSDTGENITDDFVSAVIDRGFSNPLARVAGVGRATFLLNNLSRDYSPALQANVLPRRPVRFDMTYSGTTATLFRGFIDQITPTFGQYGRRAVTLECSDAMAILDLYEGEIALLTNTSADEIIETVVAAVYTPPATSYDAGVNQFPTSAEGWGQQQMVEIRASQKIADACTSDWGRFYISGAGAPTYVNRHTMPLDSTTELTLDDTMLALAYVKSVTTVLNYVAVTCYPRTVGSVPEVLGRLSQQDAPDLAASGERIFSLQYRDPSNAKIRVGGLTVITPWPPTDLVVTDDPGGEGTDETSNVTPTMTAYGDHAEITLTNGAPYPVYVQQLQVRGYAVRAREPVTMIAQDATSITAYQRRKLTIDAPLMSNPADAQLLADYLLDVYKDPVDQVDGIEILANKDSTWMAAVRDLELLDRIVITETQTGLSAYAGHIYRMTHRINNRYEHRLTFGVETAYVLGGTPFRLDTSALNSGHILIY